MTETHDLSTLLKIVDEINVVRLHSRFEIEWIDKHFVAQSISTKVIVSALTEVENLSSAAMIILLSIVGTELANP